MKILLLTLILLCIFNRTRTASQIDEKIVEKDLYNILGLKKSAKGQEIKKAYRKLAQVHHPDKSTASNKAANAEIFTQVAEAYEILSDPAVRSEYDNLRAQFLEYQSNQNRYQNRNSADRNYRDNGGDNRGNRNQGFDDIWSMMSDQFQRYDEKLRREQPIFNFQIAGSFLLAGQPIFPYSPVLVSPEHTHFFYLDNLCSLNLVKGDIENFYLLIMSTRSPPNINAMPGFDVRFSTPATSITNGLCFAGLDHVGILRIYSGHPSDFYEHETLWSSTNVPSVEDLQDHMGYYKRFYLEIFDHGELAILVMRPGKSNAECVWSTSSCNVMVALFQNWRSQAEVAIKDAFASIRFANPFATQMTSFFDKVKRPAENVSRRLHTVFRKLHGKFLQPFFKKVNGPLRNIYRGLHMIFRKMQGPLLMCTKIGVKQLRKLWIYIKNNYFKNIWRMLRESSVGMAAMDAVDYLREFLADIL